MVTGSALRGIATEIQFVEEELLKEYMATNVIVENLYTDPGGLSVRLEFEGFVDVETATERVTEVAGDFEDADEVQITIDSRGGYDTEEGGFEGRPLGSVEAEYHVEE